MFAKYSDEALKESFMLNEKGELPEDILKIISELKAEIKE